MTVLLTARVMCSTVKNEKQLIYSHKYLQKDAMYYVITPRL